jgi:phosphodiesterase/alkaline phosphatase D-like protein
MFGERDTTERFDQARRVAGPIAGPDGDGAATGAIRGLPDARTVCDRVRFEREAERGTSESVQGRTASANRGGPGAVLGAAQAVWSVNAVTGSRALKDHRVRSAGRLVIGDGPSDSRNERWAERRRPPLGRERDLAGILSALTDRRVENRVWLTRRRPRRRRAPRRRSVPMPGSSGRPRPVGRTWRRGMACRASARSM